MEGTRVTKSRRSRWARIGAGVLAGVLWVALWVWLLAFAYSTSYFEYSLCSRAPVFAAALLASITIPVGALILWRRLDSVSGLVIGQAAVSVLSLLPLGLTSYVLARLSGPCHLSGDDAMGAGIDFILLCGTAAVSVCMLATAAVVRLARRRRGSITYGKGTEHRPR